MHYTLKVFGVLLAVTFLWGCEAQNGLKYDIESFHQSSEQYEINGEKLTLSGSSEGIDSFNNALTTETESWHEDFITRLSGVQNKSDTITQLQYSHTVHYNKNGIFSMTTDKYTYITGLHGNTWRIAKTYDANEGKVLKLCDLFNDNTYPQVLKQRIDDLIAENSDTYHDLWEEPTVDGNREDKFYLNGDKLVLFYEPYELSYYARGVIEFPIPIEEVRGYLKECYLS